MPMPPPTTSARPIDGLSSTAIYVDGGHARRGAGRALYSTLFDVLRLLGYYKATAGITLPNAASVGLHESFWFRLRRYLSGHRVQVWWLAQRHLVSDWRFNRLRAIRCRLVRLPSCMGRPSGTPRQREGW